MTNAEQKQALRNEMRSRLRLFCAQHDRAAASERVRQSVLAARVIEDADMVLGYLFHGDEADCTALLYRALALHKKVGLPRVVPGTNEMDFFLLDETLPFGDQIERGSFGIGEPVHSLEKLMLDASLGGTRVLMLVPALAFTPDGKRLGRGKGFYDRFIARIKKTGALVTLAGFCFPCQLVPAIPTDTHDARMDSVFSGDPALSF